MATQKSSYLKIGKVKYQRIKLLVDYVKLSYKASIEMGGLFSKFLDMVPVEEVISILTSKGLLSTATPEDVITALVQKAVQDYVSFQEGVNLSVIKQLTELVTPVESRSIHTTKSLTEALVAGDLASLTISKPVVELLSLGDSFIVVPTKGILDEFELGSGIHKFSVTKGIQDIAVLEEVLPKEIQKFLYTDFTVFDDIQAATGLVGTYTDLFPVEESYQFEFDKQLYDDQYLMEFFSFSVETAFADAYGLLDTWSLSVTKGVEETVEYEEALILESTKGLSDSLTIEEGGYITANTYSLGYFAEAYVGEVIPF